MAIIMEVRGAAVHAFKLISGNIQVIYITWSVPDLYLQPLPDRNPRVTRQDLNPIHNSQSIFYHLHNQLKRKAQKITEGPIFGVILREKEQPVAAAI